MKSRKFLKFLIPYILLAFLAINASAKQTHPASKTDTVFVNELISEIELLINKGEYPEARSEIRTVWHLSDSLNYEYGKASSIVQLADLYLNQQKNDSVIYILEQAIQDYPNSRRKVYFYNFLATAYQYKSDHQVAIAHYEKALSLITQMPEAGQARTTAGIRLNMASTYFSQGDRNQAFQNYLSALEFAEMTRDTVFWVTTLNNTGNAYNHVDNFEEAGYYLEKAKGLAQIKSLKIELYRINLNLANTRNNQSRYEEAIELYNTALELEREIRPGSAPVVIYYNLGRLYSSMGETKKAKEYFEESLKISEENNILPGIYYNNFGYGNLYYHNNRYDEALYHLQKAYEIAKQIQNIPFLQEARDMLYLANREANNFAEALTYLEHYKATADSLLDLEKEQALANLENKMALDRQSEINRLLQEKQVQQERRLHFQYILIVASVIVLCLILVILFLMKKRAKENQEINKHLQAQKAELEELNKSKDKLFAIISHDLRSPLASMQGILYLIKNDALSKEEIHEFAQELEQSIQQNIEAMEDLLAWAKEQLSGVSLSLEKVNIKEIAAEVFARQEFLASKKKVTLKNKIAKNFNVLADRNALELVLRNLVSNSIKFTNSGDNITVTCNLNEPYVQFIIEDTGIGIPANVSHKIFENKSWSREGTLNEKGTGFGLSLVKEFIEKMNGRIRFESEENKGTTFYIDLPKA
ncbi:MAG: tetratricopeptide repeat protein [Balneolaceae bacterium]